jgi:hypothetical protein
MQTTKNILLIRPANFDFNAETAASNTFQNKVADSAETIKEKAFAEFEIFANTLASNGIHVSIIDDTITPKKPDAVFPNNWISFHPDGTVILYPMLAENRRLERRPDIIASLKEKFTVTNIIDLSHYEKQGRFLEGTGSMVLDHQNKIAYSCLSPRTDREIFIEVCNQIQYTPVYFRAYNEKGKEIYHTNVMMCIAEKFVVICMDSITAAEEKKLVLDSLTKTGHEIITITFAQMNRFAGNMLSLQTNDNKTILALSQTALDSLTTLQKESIENYCKFVPLSITNIEKIGGGSARCMIAEIFLPALV